MSGGGMDGVSSTGYGQPSASGPGLGGNGLGLGGAAMGIGGGGFNVNNTTSADNFGSAPTQNAVAGQIPTAQLGQMNDLLRGNSQPTQPNYNDTISGYYHDILHRDPDQAGLNFWNQRANSGMSMDDIRNNFLGSQEYLQSQQPVTQQDLSQTNQTADQSAVQPVQQAPQTNVVQAPQNDTQMIQPAMATNQNAYRPQHPQAPVFSGPIAVTESGGAGSGGAINYQYRRGGIASLIR